VGQAAEKLQQLQTILDSGGRDSGVLLQQALVLLGVKRAVASVRMPRACFARACTGCQWLLDLLQGGC
jgi:hypothetical protein